MAEFLTTNGTSYNIENIIIDAKNKLILVSPYLQISKTLYERLKDASNNGVNIKIIYGKDELKPNEKKSLAELKNLELYYFDNLHAKCYFNERRMVITSMNMYEFSEKNNREMGVLIDRSNDKELFDKAVQETLSILKSSKSITLKTETVKTVKIQSNNNPYILNNQKTTKGYCLRCREKIKFNVSHPYCPDCYFIWHAFQNFDYEEKFCHKCGDPENSTMAKPLCYDCFTS